MPENFGKQMNRIVSSFLGTTGALATLQKFEETTKPEVPIDHEYYAQRKGEFLFSSRSTPLWCKSTLSPL